MLQFFKRRKLTPKGHKNKASTRHNEREIGPEFKVILVEYLPSTGKTLGS